MEIYPIEFISKIFIAVCTYRLVMISIKWFETAQKNALASTDVIVTQLLCYHMPLLYFICNHLITVIDSTAPGACPIPKYTIYYFVRFYKQFIFAILISNAYKNYYFDYCLI